MRQTLYLTSKVLVALDRHYSGLASLSQKTMHKIPALGAMLNINKLPTNSKQLVGSIFGGFSSIYDLLRAYQIMSIIISLVIAILLLFFPATTMENLLKGPIGELETVQLNMLRFMALLIINYSVTKFYAGDKKSKMATRLESVFDGVVGVFILYLWFTGVATKLTLFIGFIFLLNLEPILKEAKVYLLKNPKGLMYDLQRKSMLMEGDDKIFINLICGRLWTYVYNCYTKKLNFVQHMDIIKDMLIKKFGIKFPWNGGRVYEQNSKENSAIVEGHECFVMSSSGYAAMSQKPEILDYAIDAARNTGPNYGSYAVIGFNTHVKKLIHTLEKYYKREAAMVSASGYLACLNLVDFLINSLGASGKNKCLVLMDRFSHPCLRQGAASADKVMFFDHNDYNNCREICKKHGDKYDNILVIIESVYSTDGDIGDLPNFRKVCDEFGQKCKLIVDDAHGIGTIGPNAGGCEDYFDMVGSADYICGTLSKACSSQGGFVVSNNKTMIGAMVMSPGVGFATGMNAFSSAYATKALEWIMENGHRQVKEAHVLREYWREQLDRRFGMKADDNPTRLLTIRLNHSTKALHVQDELIKRGFLISAMTFPAVPMHQSLLRMTVVPGVLTMPIIDKFCDTLEICMEKTSFIELETNSYLLHDNIELAKKDQDRKQAISEKDQ